MSNTLNFTSCDSTTLHGGIAAASLGGGGYKDAANPEYMYAETYIHEHSLENKTLSEIEEYIESVIASYPQNHLIPSFFITE